MNIYFAPMESVTTYNYRNVYEELFGGIDKYYSPFISPTVDSDIRNKEMRDILPENNSVPSLIPQLMANAPEPFIKAAKILQNMGYEEVNFNLGCPSKTVTAKKKGSGFLRYPEEIDRFFDKVFSELDMKISVKTRAGYFEHKELLHMCEIYNRYPICELTIHPRIQKDMYNNKPDMDIFREAVGLLNMPVCYNGDVVSVEDFKRIETEFPRLSAIMIGRGLLCHPGLSREIKSGQKTDYRELKVFHGRLYDEYRERIEGDRNFLFKMKEVWGYLITAFPDSDKQRKRIMKATRVAEYDAVVAELFSKVL